MSLDPDDPPLELFVDDRHHEQRTRLAVVGDVMGIDGEISRVVGLAGSHHVPDDALPRCEEIGLTTRCHVPERIDDDRIVAASRCPETDDEVPEFQDRRERSVEDEVEVVDGHALSEELEDFEQSVLIRGDPFELPLPFAQVPQ